MCAGPVRRCRARRHGVHPETCRCRREACWRTIGPRCREPVAPRDGEEKGMRVEDLSGDDATVYRAVAELEDDAAARTCTTSRAAPAWTWSALGPPSTGCCTPSRRSCTRCPTPAGPTWDPSTSWPRASDATGRAPVARPLRACGAATAAGRLHSGHIARVIRSL